MYSTLLEAHSGVRWFVVLGLLVALAGSAWGLIARRPYGRLNAVLVSVATWSANVQFMIGLTLYIVSPVAAAFRQPGHGFEATFFGLLHPLAMLAGVSLVSVAGGMAKRAEGDRDKHRAVVVWMLAAAVVIFAAVPWPGSPFAERPWER